VQTKKEKVFMFFWKDYGVQKLWLMFLALLGYLEISRTILKKVKDDMAKSQLSL
jgi:hypothetical protein